MIQVKIWNKKSTNYNENQFVRQNGTDSFEVFSDEQVVDLLFASIRDKSIERLEIETETGLVSWVRNHSHEICKCGNCDECSDRLDFPNIHLDFPGNGELERFKRDIEDYDDFYLNDPRR